jgi:5-methylthioribose kinase
VLLVELPGRGERFVLKQARGQLRVKEEWLCPIERIWREVETLQICSELLGQSQNADCGLQRQRYQPCVPEVLWEDRENYCFAMTAAPPDHATWKELLLAGDLASAGEIARVCGELLATLHGASWGNGEIAAKLDDRTFFDLLRIDPYYRHIAKVHPDLAPQIQQLIESVWSHRLCLVHGDFSPKNLLVWHSSRLAPRDEGITRSVMPTHVMLIDCEVGHYGDPAFDLGFFLTHLVLKSLWAESSREFYLELPSLFWNGYRGELRKRVSASDLQGLECRTIGNLAGCMLARVDGKSPVDYLTAAQRATVRQLSRRWLAAPPVSIGEAAALVTRGTCHPKC